MRKRHGDGGHTAELEISTCISELARARAFVVEGCARAGARAEVTQRLTLAVTEVCANIIEHGGVDVPILLALSWDHGRVRLTVSDEGADFDPRSLPPVDVSAGIDRPVRGVGWHLALRSVDHVCRERAHGRNILTLGIDDPGIGGRDGQRTNRSAEP